MAKERKKKNPPQSTTPINVALPSGMSAEEMQHIIAKALVEAEELKEQEKTEQETSVYSKTLTLQESPALAKSNDESDDLNHLQQTTQQDLIQNTDSISKCASQNSQEELHK